MNTRALFSLSISALMLGGTMVGCAGGNGGIASASDRNQAVSAKAAATNAGRATKALANRDAAAAIGFAEGAVAMAPTSADYRVLLGQSYLQAGRFTSARDAFGDALQLAPDNGKAALNFALAQTATGDWDGARRTLAAHASVIPASDRGLATALAGDPAGAVAMLTEAARTPGADAKTRQNLALALALSGQWGAAKMVAEADISPADVDSRMAEWAAFAQPHSASDQVAALLGVAPVQDAGQPIALALNAPVTPVTMADAKAPAAIAEVAPVAVAAPAPVAVAMATPAAPEPVAVAAVVAVPVAVATPMARATKIAFGPRAEIVQAVPVATIRPAIGGFKLAVAKPPVARAQAVRASGVPAPTRGEYFVQIGAFDSAGVAKDAWGRAKRRYAALSGHVPSGMNFSTGKGSFYRLSVGGFARAEAKAMCRSYRAHGGVCFVRAGAGDQAAQWLRKGGVQMASR